MKQNAFFIIFEGLSLTQIKQFFFGRRESDFKIFINASELTGKMLIDWSFFVGV